MRIINSTIKLILGLLCFGFSIANAQNAPTFNSGQDPKPSGKKWVKVDNMSDEFDGTSLNGAKWQSEPVGNGWTWVGRPPGLFDKDAVSVAGGNMRVTVSKLNSPQWVNGKEFLYEGAIVRSINSGQHGWYYECKMKANATTMSSTFWLMSKNSNCNTKLELDIQECVGRTTSLTDSWASNWDQIYHSNAIHRTTSCVPTPVQKQGSIPTNVKNHERYFVYGCWWKSPTELRFYLDGQYVYSITPSTNFNVEAWLQMAIETYDWNPVPAGGGKVASGTWAERTTQYDWIRTWKLEDEPTNSGNTFFIINRETGKKIRTKNSVDGDPLELVPASWSGAPTQWTKVDSGNGYFYLKNVNTGMYFRALDGSDGSVMVQRPTSYSGNWTQWKEVPTSDGYFYLQNRETGMYFRPETDVDYSPIIQRPTSYSGNWTQWKFVDVNGGARVANTFPAEVKLGDLQVYPNPAQAQLTLQGISDGVYKTTIYNLQGRLIKELNIDILNNSSSIDIADLQKGIYILNVQNHTLNTRVRFVKE